MQTIIAYQKMVLVFLVSSLWGYITASGVGVVFLEAYPLPLVSRIWWMAIPLTIFTILFLILGRTDNANSNRDSQ